MDSIDKASQLEEAQRKAAIEAARGSVSDDNESFEECIICSDKIPLARRKAIKGCKTCINCQREMES